MRAKFFISCVLGLGLMNSSAAFFTQSQTRFDPAEWKAAAAPEASATRLEMLDPLLSQVLKAGMSIQVTEDLLGCSDEENHVEQSSVFSPPISRTYIISAGTEGQEPVRLVLEFSADNKLVDFYSYEESKPVIF